MSTATHLQGKLENGLEKVERNGLNATAEANNFSSNSKYQLPKEENEMMEDCPSSPTKEGDSEGDSPSDTNAGNSYPQPSTSTTNITARVEAEYEEGGEEEPDVECKYCKYRLQPSAEKKYPRVVFCGECGWNSVEAWKLQRHFKLRHSPFERPSYYCQHCEYRVNHPTTWQGDDRPYECGECDYRARTSTALNYHLRAKHSDERPYKCPHCSYAGVQSSSLKSHMMTRHNTGEKNILCPMCDFRANIPSIMRKHLERKHAGSRSRRSRRSASTNDPEQVDKQTHRVLSDLLAKTPLRSPSLPEPPIVPPQIDTIQRPPDDVAHYLQMPSFGLFEAIYESQGLSPEKVRNPGHKSDVIIIDD